MGRPGPGEDGVGGAVGGAQGNGGLMAGSLGAGGDPAGQGQGGEQLPGAGGQDMVPVLRQLLEILKSGPPTPQQEQDVLAILRANPQLMSLFIKHREDARNRLHQGQGQPKA